MTRVLKVELLLACTHFKVETLDGYIFIPKTGEDRHCNQCGKDTSIIRVGNPYRESLEDNTPNNTTNNLNMFEKE